MFWGLRLDGNLNYEKIILGSTECRYGNLPGILSGEQKKSLPAEIGI
jgi:hypothetical protein